MSSSSYLFISTRQTEYRMVFEESLVQKLAAERWANRCSKFHHPGAITIYAITTGPGSAPRTGLRNEKAVFSISIRYSESK